MALYAKYLNGVIAPMNNLDNLYSLQSEDGYISMTYDIIKGTQAYGVRVNPPLYAWCEWEYYRFSGDRSRIDKVLPKLVDYYYWLKNNRRRKNGLYFFEAFLKRIDDFVILGHACLLIFGGIADERSHLLLFVHLNVFVRKIKTFFLSSKTQSSAQQRK